MLWSSSMKFSPPTKHTPRNDCSLHIKYPNPIKQGVHFIKNSNKPCKAESTWIWCDKWSAGRRVKWIIRVEWLRVTVSLPFIFGLIGTNGRVEWIWSWSWRRSGSPEAERWSISISNRWCWSWTMIRCRCFFYKVPSYLIKLPSHSIQESKLVSQSVNQLEPEVNMEWKKEEKERRAHPRRRRSMGAGAGAGAGAGGGGRGGGGFDGIPGERERWRHSVAKC